MKLMSEHDGVGVFANDEGAELQAKLDSLANYLRSYSSRRFGIPIVIKEKRVFDWSNADLFMEMEHKLSELSKEYGKLKPIVTQRQRKYYAGKRDENAGKAYADALRREHELLRRNKEVIDYWVGREGQPHQ